jgi:hypothetical protein
MGKSTPRNNEIIQQIIISCRQDDLLYVRPEHPFLISGPDILIKSKNQLYSIFVPTASELRVPDFLSGRIVGARLAYPSFVAPIILFDGPLDYVRTGNVPTLPNTQELMLFVRKGDDVGDRINKELAYAKQLHQRRYATVLKENRDSIRIVSPTVGLTDNFTSPFVRERKPVNFDFNSNFPKNTAILTGVRSVETDSGIILTSTSKMSAKRAIHEITQASYANIYSLDDTVPYTRSERIHRNIFLSAEVTGARQNAIWFSLLNTNSY